MRTSTEMILIQRQLWRLYFQHPLGLTDTEAGLLLRCDRRTIRRYRLRMWGEIREITRGRFTAIPDREQIELARAILFRAEYENTLSRARNPFDL